MLQYYFLMTIIMVIFFGILIFFDDNTRTGYYLKIMSLIFVIANAGYWILGASTTLETAILAKKITYLAGCFNQPLMLFYMCALCNIDVSKYIKRILYLYSMFVYALVLTTGYSDIYYKEVHLEYIGNATSLANTHGRTYVFFYAILFGYMLSDILIVIYAQIKERISNVTVMILGSMQLVTIGGFLIGRVIDHRIELMPAVYVIDILLFLILYVKFTQYDMAASIQAAVEQNNTDGYIMFDDKLRYLGCNDIAESIIPALSELRVDSHIKPGKEEFYIVKWVQAFINDGHNGYSFSVDGKYYEEYVRVIDKRKRKAYLIELQDNTERKKYLDLLSNYNDELEEQVENQLEHIKEIQRKTILGMATMVEGRDPNTGGHIKRTSEVVNILVSTIKENQLFDMPHHFGKYLTKAAPMHDLGKIAIPDYILMKPGRFEPEEFEIMKSHAAKSADIVEEILRGVEEDAFVDVAANVARYHHEKWNGKGYPTGLAGEDIPLEARIMAIADVYDALVSKRCYKEAMSFEKANEIILESFGEHFDPALKEMYVLSRNKLEAYYSAS